MVDKKGITAWSSRQVKESVGSPDVNISVGYLKGLVVIQGNEGGGEGGVE